MRVTRPTSNSTMLTVILSLSFAYWNDNRQGNSHRCAGRRNRDGIGTRTTSTGTGERSGTFGWYRWNRDWVGTGPTTWKGTSFGRIVGERNGIRTGSASTGGSSRSRRWIAWDRVGLRTMTRWMRT
jgi:hypothetical protein